MRALLLCFLCVSFYLSAKSQPIVNVGKPFEFELHTSNIFPWITGQKNGAVVAEKNSMGKGLEKFLLSSKSELLLALYGVSKQPWLLAVIETLRDRGVTVQAVVDQKRGAVGDWVGRNFTYPDTAKLPSYLGLRNISIDLNAKGRYPRPSIMHHKYVVSDSDGLWFGTANLSHTGVGAEYNANVALSVRSSHLAGLFRDEFRQMFDHHRFSKAKRVLNNHKIFKFKDGTAVQAFFSPQDGVIDRAILPVVRSAQRTIDIGMFYLTDRAIVQELCRASDRGVQVRIIVDAVANSHPSSPYQYLRRCQVNIKVENWGGKMHMKTSIVDSNRVIIGSMNWSRAGDERNDENLVVIDNNNRLVKELSAYFDGMWRSLSNKSQTTRIMAEGRSSINSCSDGLDNDHDGRVDDKDGGCRL